MDDEAYFTIDATFISPRNYPDPCASNQPLTLLFALHHLLPIQASR